MQSHATFPRGTWALVLANGACIAAWFFVVTNGEGASMLSAVGAALLSGVCAPVIFAMCELLAQRDHRPDR